MTTDRLAVLERAIRHANELWRSKTGRDLWDLMGTDMPSGVFEAYEPEYQQSAEALMAVVKGE